ncbi:hypothetical protein [Nocardia sp. NPDC005745]|uniref:hypothetical protein n=1 Tax=Nocardia sp. NPDC005745 TaxID=3157061 RepID=UPI00340438AC
MSVPDSPAAQDFAAHPSDAMTEPVLCEQHDGVHELAADCVWPHNWAPNGRTWADGTAECPDRLEWGPERP